MDKAIFIGVCRKNRYDRHAWEHTDLMYEYRGHQYIVTKDNNGYMGESLKAQHTKAQKEIDERISHENDPEPEWRYEGSAQEALDLFFKEYLDL